MKHEKSVLPSDTCFLFRGTAPEEAERILTDAQTVAYCKHARFTAGTVEGHTLGIVVRGRLAVIRENRGTKPIVLNELSAGNVFGVLSLFATEPPPQSTMEALEGTEVLYPADEAVRDAIRNCPSVAENVISFLADRAVFLNRRVGMFSSATQEEKLLCWLRSHVSDPEDRSVRCTPTAICRATGIPRATLYRLFESLSGRGIIRLENKKIYLNEESQL